uniref:Uncharacterized protein n=1 Tax=Cacopsylla melanoneura TaxID=428564 RepID=A0A8D9EFI3_9HEMI
MSCRHCKSAEFWCFWEQDSSVQKVVSELNNVFSNEKKIGVCFRFCINLFFNQFNVIYFVLTELKLQIYLLLQKTKSYVLGTCPGPGLFYTPTLLQFYFPLLFLFGAHSPS